MQEDKYILPQGGPDLFGAGLLTSHEAEYMEKLVEFFSPLKQELDQWSLEKYELHISMRYFGYYQDFEPDAREKMKAMCKEVYKDVLPIVVQPLELVGSWEKNPELPNAYILLKVGSPKLFEIYNTLIENSREYHIFEKIEDKNYSPHITVGKKEDAPTDFMKEFVEKNRNTFNLEMTFDHWFWAQDGVMMKQ